MVVRTRLRRILLPLVLYVVSGSIGGFFIWHAINGDRGLKVSDEYEKSITLLQVQLAATKKDHANWQHRIELLSGATVDRDLLSEESRSTLNRIGRDEVVVFLHAR